MTSDTKNHSMQKFTVFINTLDERLAQDLIAKNAVFYVPGQTSPLQGPSGYLFILAMMRGGFPDIQWTLEETISEGDRVAARFTMRGTHNGTFLGMPATGRQFKVQAINLYRWSDGKIVEEHGQPDLFGLMQQIGAVPTP